MRKRCLQIAALLLTLAYSQGYAQNINTIAGGLGDGGAATAGKLANPNSVAVDRWGNLYIADFAHGQIRKIDTFGIISTLARISQPKGIAVDTLGNVYTADASSRHIVKINQIGSVSIFAGTGGSSDYGDGGPATAAQLTAVALSFDKLGNLYAVDNNGASCKIRKINTAGIITTVAGNGAPGLSGDGFAATLAKLRLPTGVSVDRLGNIYIADNGNNRVRKVDTAGIITTFAGNGIVGYAGDGSTALTANFNAVTGVATDTAGNVYIADNTNGEIRKVNSAGIISRFAGAFISSGFSGDGGAATVAQMSNPIALTFDGAGNLYIVDNGNNRIRKVNTAGIMTTVAGCSSSYVLGYSGDGGPAISALLNNPTCIAYDTMKNLYIADRDNHCIRKVDPTGIITTIAGNNVAGFSGDGGNATLAKLSQPSSVATDRKGNIYICDAGNRRIRVISSTGVISTYAGNGTNTSTGDGGPATNAGFTSVYSIAVDRQGNLYISENIGFRIRKVDTNGIITTFAGTGVSGYYGDGGAATAAQIRPYAISADNSGNLLFTDTYNYRVRKIDTSGRIITVAGNGSTGAIGIGSLAIFTGIGLPVGVVSDDVGNIFISSTNQIFQVDTFGIITKFAGNGSNTYNGDGLPATNAAISGSASLAFDKAGDLLIADVDNYRVRIIYNAKVTVSAAQDTVCLGSGTVFTSVVNAASVYSPHYHWVKNGFPVGTDSFRYTAPVLNNGDIVYCYITDGLTGPSIAESNRKTMVVVTPTILPSVVAYLSSSTSLCAGTTVTCNAVSIVNGGSAPTIDWYKNGVHVFTGLLYTFIPSDHDIVNCKLTSSLPCLLVDTAMSSNIVFTVTAPAYPTIRITNSSPGGGGSRYCAGSIAHCSINSRSLDVSPVFEWFLNGVDTFTGYNYNFVPRNGDYVVCRMITMATCVVTDTVFSNTLVFGVDSPANPTVTITSDTGTSICSGIKVNCTAAPVLGGTSPSYSWYVNGALKAPSGNTYSFTPSDGDSLYCVMVSNSGCLLTNSATSNPLKFTYITPQPASVSIAISPSDTICLGETLTATATPVNGGTAPRFRWHVGFNSIDAGPTYTWTPTTDQPVNCEMFSSTCALPRPATSSTSYVHLILNAPKVQLASDPGNFVCSGVPVTVTATGINEGTAPIYDWYQNGTPVFTGNPFTFLPANGDNIICMLTSNASCLNWPVTYSTPSYFHIDSAPTIVISCVPGNVNFKGTSVTLIASVYSGIGNYSLQWYKNNTAIPGATNATYTTSDFSIWDSVYCMLNSYGACVGEVKSNILLMQSYHTMRLYPNPNNGNFTLSGNNYDANGNPVAIRIYNEAGKLVYEKDAAFDAITFHTDINLERTLPPGVYTLKLKYSLENLSFFFVIE